MCMYYYCSVVFQEPVVLMGTELVASALHWDLPYLEKNMGNAKHTVYISRTHDFMYFDDRKVHIHVHCM